MNPLKKVNPFDVGRGANCKHVWCFPERVLLDESNDTDQFSRYCPLAADDVERNSEDRDWDCVSLD